MPARIFAEGANALSHVKDKVMQQADAK